MQYKPAIDGLRAIAVILVLLFHAQTSLFSGGYIGVDVFFVISGYLITSLIVAEYDHDSFTITGFYARRARRILPALFIVAFTTLGLATLVFLPRQLSQLGSSAVAATLFVSNLYFSRKHDYFLDYTELQPLLHTWSLAVEEQFYILFPVVALIILRSFKRYLSHVLFGCALLSFLISIYLTHADPQAAFYSSAARAWELLLGAWIAVAARADPAPLPFRPALQWIGLLMILGSAFAYDNFTPFPGCAALLPAVGSALLIAWSDQDSRLVRILSNPVMVWIGLISYPLYLWHWPLLTLSQQLSLRDLHGGEVLVIYAAALILSIATWRLVELPIRARKPPFSSRQISVSSVGFGCLLAASGLVIRATNGMQARLPAGVVQILDAGKDLDSNRYACHNWDRTISAGFSNCAIGASDQAVFDFAFWGDSIPGSMASVVDSAARSAERKGLQLTIAACPPLLQTYVVVRHRQTKCSERNDAAVGLLQRFGIRHVIMEADWQWYADGEEIGFDRTWPVELRSNEEIRLNGESPSIFQKALEATIARLRAGNIDVTVLGPIPKIGWNVPEVLAALEWRGSPLRSGPTLVEFMEQQKSVFPIMKALERDGVRVIYPHEYLCQINCLIASNDQILYRDGTHLTTRGAGYLRPMFTKLFTELGKAT